MKPITVRKSYRDVRNFKDYKPSEQIAIWNAMRRKIVKVTKEDCDNYYTLDAGTKERLIGECLGEFGSMTFTGHLIPDTTRCTCYHFEKRPIFKKQSPEEEKRTDELVESIISATVGVLLVETGIIPKSIIDKAYGTH